MSPKKSPSLQTRMMKNANIDIGDRFDYENLGGDYDFSCRRKFSPERRSRAGVTELLQSEEKERFV